MGSGVMVWCSLTALADTVCQCGAGSAAHNMNDAQPATAKPADNVPVRQCAQQWAEHLLLSFMPEGTEDSSLRVNRSKQWWQAGEEVVHKGMQKGWGASTEKQ